LPHLLSGLSWIKLLLDLLALKFAAFDVSNGLIQNQPTEDLGRNLGRMGLCHINKLLGGELLGGELLGGEAVCFFSIAALSTLPIADRQI
jgi:hypothetical protein